MDSLLHLDSSLFSVKNTVDHPGRGVVVVNQENRTDSTVMINFPQGDARGQGQGQGLRIDFFNGETSSTTSNDEFQRKRICHEDDEKSLKRVRGLVRSSQRVVHQQEFNDDADSLLFSEPLLQLLEPTPLGPRETQTIVSNLSLADINYWRGDHHHQQDLISSLLLTSTSTDSTNCSMNMKRPACDDANKKYKRHPTVLELQQDMSTAQEKEAQSNIMDYSFEEGTISQAATAMSNIINSSCSGSRECGLPQHDQEQSRKNTAKPCSKNKTNANESQSASKTIPSKTMLHPHHCDQWNDRFQDLMDFKNLHGHCLVPHDYSQNPKLSQWVKRQRYQHRLKHSNRHSTLTDFREHVLEEMGFVWDSHKAAWTEKLETLKMFKSFHGHCNVPTNYDSDPSLAIWVKCQRRQYRLYCLNQPSTMNNERVSELNALDFEWNPRGI